MVFTDERVDVGEADAMLCNDRFQSVLKITRITIQAGELRQLFALSLTNVKHKDGAKSKDHFTVGLGIVGGGCLRSLFIGFLSLADHGSQYGNPLLPFLDPTVEFFPPVKPEPHERILLTETGAPLYRDESRRAQSSFGNTWRRLRRRVETNNPEAAVSKLPFGTLRNQMPDWLGGEQGKAIVASVG